MDEKVMDQIENSESYKKLVKERSRFAWKLAGAMIHGVPIVSLTT